MKKKSSASPRCQGKESIGVTSMTDTSVAVKKKKQLVTSAQGSKLVTHSNHLEGRVICINIPSPACQEDIPAKSISILENQKYPALINNHLDLKRRIHI